MMPNAINNPAAETLLAVLLTIKKS
jgi:hypothetical protein